MGVNGHWQSPNGDKASSVFSSCFCWDGERKNIPLKIGFDVTEGQISLLTLLLLADGGVERNDDIDD